MAPKQPMSLKSIRSRWIISGVLATLVSDLHGQVQFDIGDPDAAIVNGALQVTVGESMYSVPHVLWASASYLAVGPLGVYSQTGGSLHLNNDIAVKSVAALLTDTNVWYYSGSTIYKAGFGLQVIMSYAVNGIDAIGIVKTSTRFWAIGVDGCVHGLVTDDKWCASALPVAWVGDASSIFLGFSTGTVIRLDHGPGLSASAATILGAESLPGSTALIGPTVLANATAGRIRANPNPLRKIRVTGCNLTIHFEFTVQSIDACTPSVNPRIPEPPPPETFHHQVYVHDNLCSDGKYTLYMYGYPAVGYPEYERCKDITSECVSMFDGTSKKSSCAPNLAEFTPPINQQLQSPCEPLDTSLSPTQQAIGPVTTPNVSPCVAGWWFDGAACFPCNKCTTGQRLSQKCTQYSQTVCSDCEPGTYMSDEWHAHTVCFPGNGCPSQTIYKNGVCPHTAFRPIYLIWLIIPGYVGAISFATITNRIPV